MSRLVVRNLKKKFNSVWALRGFNLTLDPGEIFVLLGPNGAGKTTTLKLITGLLRPTEGEIFIEGTDLRKDPIKAKSHIGYVPDEPFIYNKLTGREFINFVASIYKVSRVDYETRLAGLLKTFDIGEWVDELSESYSHGMKQRVIMCQLLLHNPELILIDEPLVGLDPKTSKTVRELFIKLKEEGKTLFVSTHTLSFAREVATKIGIISQGELKFIGDINELSRISGKKDIEDIYLKLSNANDGVHR
ncbi:MAG: ABC transporter ATP-binding protein [candidate division WOR-3 bacterium]|nr:MAG: ABC transporter ATP-binding protein [candidate division WOR-3 bacterium]